MLRILLSVLVLCFTQLAWAQQNPCNAVNPPATYWTDLSKVGGQFDCQPPGVNFGVKWNINGAVPYWYCPTNEGAWRLNFAAATWSAMSTGTLKSDTPLADPKLTAVWCPHQAEMLAAAPPPPQQPAGSYATSGLTAYSTTGGRLGARVGTVALGTACDCSKQKVMVGTAAYCAFAGSATGVVAQCKPAP